MADWTNHTGKYVEVICEDMSYYPDTVNRNEQFDLVKLTIIGQVVRQTATCIAVAHQINWDSDDVRHVSAIPLRMVAGIRVIGEDTA